MMTRVRELADMQTSNEAQAFVTDAELKRALNRNLKQLYQKLIIARGDDYYATRYTTALVANQAEYAFGLFVPDFMQLLGVDITDGTRVVPMPKFILKEYADLKYLENLNTNDLGMFRYRLNKQGIEIRPMPRTANYSLTLHYLPAFTELVNAGDTFDGVNGWGTGPATAPPSTSSTRKNRLSRLRRCKPCAAPSTGRLTRSREPGTLGAQSSLAT